MIGRAGLWRWCWVAILLLGAGYGVARAAGEGDLHLRVETGEHEADVNRVALLPGSDAVVTVSDDKTARIWVPGSLAPLGVLRPPLGPQDDGALYAVAATAQRIAVAGRTGDGTGRFAVHLFAASNGNRPLGNIAGLMAPVVAMRFSPDGNILVLGLQGRAGVQAFDMRSGTELPMEQGFEGSVTAIDFAPDGRMVVAAADGRIRLYGPHMRRLLVGSLPGGARPFGVAFAPDGTYIAVGDRLRPMVHLLEAGNLRLLRTLDASAAERQGSLHVVTFGRDGALYAAGSYKDGTGARLLMGWGAGGRVRFEAKVGSDTVTDLLALNDGVIFTSSEPSVGRVDALGRLAALRQGRHMELRDVSERAFRLSGNGSLIDLPAGPRGRAMVFDVQARELRPADAPTLAALVPARSAGPGLVATDWKNSVAPKFNGVAVPLEPAETTRAVAVAPSGAAVLGTDFYVRFFAQGREAWRKVAPSPVWAVNLSTDGRRVVAGLGNGTVVWYSAATGEELMSLFVEPETQRWVMWTPEGFFDHDHRSDGQPDGRTLIGYRRNTADRRSSEFVEIGQLYPVFFRPDLVGLSLRDIPLARQAVANQRERIGDVATILGRGLPPAVALVDICGREAGGRASGCPAARVLDRAASGSAPMQTAGDTLLVQYRMQERGGRLGQVVVRRNNAVIAPTVFVSEEAPRMRAEEVTIPLGDGLNVIRITPVNATGEVEANDAESREIRVMRVASAARSAGKGVGGQVSNGSGGRRPVERVPVTLYVLSVGVGSFQRPEFNLANSANDARALARLMGTATPPVYDTSNVVLLTDADATAEKILAALHGIADKAGPDDLVVIFLAGHGQQVDGRYYFAPVEFGTKDDVLFRRAVQPAAAGGAPGSERALDELFRKEGLGQDRMLAAIQRIQAARVAMILDTCFSASIATQDAVLRRDLNATVTNTLGHAAGRFVLSSSTALALDSAGSSGGAGSDLPRDAEGHGLFTSFMLRALNGEADFDRAGRIDIYKLATFTKRAVERATADMRQPQQPAFFFAGSQFFDLRAVPVKP